MWDFLTANWAELALALVGFLGTFTALTESTKDDHWTEVLKRILSAVVLGKTK